MAHATPTLEIHSTNEADFFYNGWNGGKMFVVTEDSEQWLDWVKLNKLFRVVSMPNSNPMTFTARKELRHKSKKVYWYAYKRIGKKLKKVYIGKEDVSLKELIDTANYFISLKNRSKDNEG